MKKARIQSLVVNFKGDRPPVEIVEPDPTPTRRELISATKPSLWCVTDFHNENPELRILYPISWNKPQEYYRDTREFGIGGYRGWKKSVWNVGILYDFVERGRTEFLGWLE